MKVGGFLNKWKKIEWLLFNTFQSCKKLLIEQFAFNVNSVKKTTS